MPSLFFGSPYGHVKPPLLQALSLKKKKSTVAAAATKAVLNAFASPRGKNLFVRQTVKYRKMFHTGNGYVKERQPWDELPEEEEEEEEEELIEEKGWVTDEDEEKEDEMKQQGQEVMMVQHDVPEMEMMVEPVLEPVVVPQPMKMPEPVVEPEPVAVSEVIVEPMPVAASDQATEQQVTEQQVSEPEQVAEPEQIAVSQAAAEPIPVTEPEKVTERNTVAEVVLEPMPVPESVPDIQSVLTEGSVPVVMPVDAPLVQHKVSPVEPPNSVIIEERDIPHVEELAPMNFCDLEKPAEVQLDTAISDSLERELLSIHSTNGKISDQEPAASEKEIPETPSVEASLHPLEEYSSESTSSLLVHNEMSLSSCENLPHTEETVLAGSQDVNTESKVDMEDSATESRSQVIGTTTLEPPQPEEKYQSKESQYVLHTDSELFVEDKAPPSYSEHQLLQNSPEVSNLQLSAKHSELLMEEFLDFGSMNQTLEGRLVSTPSQKFKFILPIPSTAGHVSSSLAFIVDPAKPLSYLQQLIQSELPFCPTGPLHVSFNTSDIELPDSVTNDTCIATPINSALDSDPISIQYSNSTENRNKSKTCDASIRWSASTEIGAFIGDSSKARFFTIIISPPTENARVPLAKIRVTLPSFEERISVLRAQLRGIATDISHLSPLKSECDAAAQSAVQQRSILALAVSGFVSILLPVAILMIFASLYQPSVLGATIHTQPVTTYLAAGIGDILLLGAFAYLWTTYNSNSREKIPDPAAARKVYHERGFNLDKWEYLLTDERSLKTEIRKIAEEYGVHWDEERT
ncbi:hypothetical protein BDZ91DRAFT_714554 [Kalaharituber pfeilii]|nr:hypothetical protein BDZ91DRAFT_714554 [Kalaharituber pfeilii]